MRTINFRDGVLHAVAYKLGLDPDQSNFLNNQAIPIGTFIDEWVRRVYDARDWPEWTVTHKFAPNAGHIVTWDAIAIDLVIPPHLAGTLVQLGRVLKVFLVDPATTDAPVDTPYTLTDSGIHVGYEHGQYVWVRYIAPAPKFTAVQWRPDATYQKDDPTYSYTTGECYKSKVNNNINHDPTSQGAPNPPPPATEITQPWVPDNPGLAERNQILVIGFTQDANGDTVPDPPPASTEFYIDVYDVATDTLLAEALHTASGAESLATIITNLAGDLTADPDLSTYTITFNTTLKTITLENASIFICTHSNYTQLDGIPHLLKIVVTQAYIPAMAAVPGEPQIIKITMTPETTFPGATYTLTITDSAGADHTVEYESAITDSAAQILQGLILAIESSGDTYFEDVQLNFDPSLLTLDVSIKDNASVDIVTTTDGSAYWELVKFPRALADQVIRGAYGDLLKEWGQTDKGTSEEQAVPAETAIAEGDFDTVPNPPLTGQQRPLSRYRV